MARTRQLVDLRAEVRQKADIENDPHITDSELTRYLNQSAVALYSEIVQLDEGDFITKTTIPTVAGQEDYALPAAFYKMASIPPIVNAFGSRIHLKRWQQDARAVLLDGTRGWIYGQPIYYRLTKDDQISFLPVPDSVLNVEIWYIPALTDMAADSDTYDGRAGWEEWVVWDAAIKCGIKDEKSLDEMVQERDRVFARIRPKAASKDMNQTGRVRDVEGDYSDY